MPPSPTDEPLQLLLDASHTGDEATYGQLLAHAVERLRRLARKMLRAFPDLRRWEMTDDVLQNALLRLHRCLAEVRPRSTKDFFNLAAVQMRRELLDLAKHHFGPQGGAANHHTDGHGLAADDEGGPLRQLQDAAEEPATLDDWTEFHAQVEALPEDERQAVGLLYYQGLSQEEAAAVLGVSVRTVKRRWQSARLLLARALQGQPPP
jgi:RNA polymerase sigma-70 factor (ECF subfamily)